MFGRRERKDSSLPSSPTRRFTDAYAVETVIGADVVVKGEIRGKTNLEIRGTLDGSTDIEGLVVVRKGGKLSGQMRTTNAVVEGTVDGTVVASGKVELGATARMTGDIQARSVAIAEGSYFQGKVHMSGKDASAFREKRKSEGSPASES